MSNTIFTKTDDSIVSISAGPTLSAADYPVGWNAIDIKSVNIGTAVNVIANETFIRALNMESVTIPSTVTNIGKESFEFTGLSSVNIPASVNTIDEYAFGHITNLKTVTIYTSAAPAVGSRMFFGSINIETAILDFSGHIVMNMFSSQPSLTSVTMSNVTSIGFQSFASTTSLTSVTIPNTVISIGEQAFKLSGLTSINIPSSVMSIGTETFASTTSLTSVTIPNTVISIGEQAFKLSGLTSINIPSSVMSIGTKTFANTMSLTSVTFDSNFQPSTFSFTTFSFSGLSTVYMSNNTLNYLNLHYTSSLFFGLNPSFFGDNSVVIISIDPSPYSIFDYTYFTSDISVNNYTYNSSTNIVSFSIENTDLSTNILFKDNYNLTVTLVGGGGGGGSSGYYEEINPGEFKTGYSSGGGGGGGGIGQIMFQSSTDASYNFQVGGGGGGGIGANNINDGTMSEGSQGKDTIISNVFENIEIVATGGNGGNAWMNNQNNVLGGTNGILTISDPNSIITTDISGNGGSGGNGANTPLQPTGTGTNGTDSVPSTSIEVIPMNTIFIGGGGGGGSSTNNNINTSEMGGGGGNGSGGTAGGSSTQSGETGIQVGAGGGGGGKPGTITGTYDGKNDTYSYYYCLGGTGKQGNIYIYFSPPLPPPTPPSPHPTPSPLPPISNRPGPINICNSRFAKCNLNKKNKFSSGNVTIQGATNSQRVSTQIQVQSTMRNATWTNRYVPVNGYGQRTGGPNGSGQSPKNSF